MSIPSAVGPGTTHCLHAWGTEWFIQDCTMDTSIPVDHEQISTYVFVDLETTGLLDQKRNCRITELSMIAVDRIDMQSAGDIPRVLNKVTLCMNPIKPISACSSRMTGLYNDSLEHKKAFSAEIVQFINSFLNIQTKPICLLAHNGNRFDFPLLVAELNRINQSFDNEILCADTLEMFRSLDGLSARYEPHSSKEVGNKTASPRTSNESTPTKPIRWIQQSPQKRKLTVSDVYAANNISPKIGRQSDSTSSVNDSRYEQQRMSKEKVKIALKFEDKDRSCFASNCNTDDTVKNTDKEVSNCEVKIDYISEVKGELSASSLDKEEPLPEFSNSLEDSDYLQALEVETDLYGKEGNRNTKETSTGNVSLPTNQTETTCSPSAVVSSGTHPTRDHIRNVNESSDESTNSNIQKRIGNIEKNVEILELDATVIKTDKSLNRNDAVIKSDDAVCEVIDLTNSQNEDIPQAAVRGIKAVEPVNVVSPRESDLVDSLKTGSSSPTKTDSETKSNINCSSSVTSGSFTNGAISKSSLSANASVKPLHASMLHSPSTSTNALASPSNSTSGSPIVPKVPSYKLEEIHLRKFENKPPVSHSAEGDCVTLLKVVKHTTNFMEWVDKHAVLLSSIPLPY